VNAKKETKKGKNISRNIYILIKYAESMQKVCSPKTLLCLTLSTYLVLQQLSLFQTARPYFTKCIKTLNIFVETFLKYSPDIFGLTSSFFLSCVFRQIKSFPE